MWLRAEVKRESERETDGSLVRAWCDEVGPAKGGEKIIERLLVGNIEDGELQCHAFAVAPLEQVVRSEAEVEQVPRCNTRRIGVVVRRSFRVKAKTLRFEGAARTCGNGIGRGCRLTATREACHCLLRAAETQEIVK